MKPSAITMRDRPGDRSPTTNITRVADPGTQGGTFDAMPTLFHRQHCHMFWRAWQAQVLSSVYGLLAFGSCLPMRKETKGVPRLLRFEGGRAVRRLDSETVDGLLLLASGLFDQAFYVARNPDIPSQGLEPIRHYLAHGGMEGRRPSPDFDGALYLSAYADIGEAGVNPLLHFIKWGVQEGRLDAVSLVKPPTTSNSVFWPDSHLSAMTWMATALQDVEICTADPALTELQGCLIRAWENLHQDVATAMQALELTQVKLYNRTIDFERSVSVNEKMMTELATISDNVLGATARAEIAERELEIVQRQLASLSEDLGEANRETVYWRRKALGRGEGPADA